MKKLILNSIVTVICFCANAQQNAIYHWAKSIGGTVDDISRFTTVDVSGNVYTTGYFSGTVDFDPGAGIANLTATGGTQDIFISKLDASGNFVWAKKIGGTGSDEGYSIAIDVSGNVYTTGFFYGTVDFDPGAGTFNLTSTGLTDIFISKLDASGNFVWAKSIGGTSSDEGHSIALDATGNVYTIGNFYGTVDFDPGAGIVNLASAVGADIFISKLDNNGNFVWAKRIGGTTLDWGPSIALDATGNVYTTGSFSGTADFDPGAGTVNLTSAGNIDIFISKLDASGNFVWAKSMGGGGWTAEHYGISIALDASGNVYTTGYFNVIIDCDPGAGTFNLNSAGNYDIFISKLDASGNFVWAKSIGGTGDDRGYFLALDASGNVYTTGYFSGTIDFDPGAGIVNLTSAGGIDIFISKLDASGSFVWAKKIGGIGNDRGYSIAIDGTGSVYPTGYFSGTVDFDPGTSIVNLTSVGSYDIFISKYSQTGIPVLQHNPQLILNSATILAGQSIIFTGSFFKNNGQVKLTITGPFNFSQTISGITANSQGSFNYTYITNSNLQAGLYNVVATDLVSGNTSPVKTFTITNTVNTANLTIVSPTQNFSITANQPFNIEWKDKMVTGNNYTITGSKRNYNYSIELSSNGGSSWQQIGTKQGMEYINVWKNLSFNTSVTNTGSNNLIRVVDVYKTSNSDTTALFTVNAIVTNVSKVDLKWDYSYPQTAIPVNGVAADGVARIFLDLSKIDNTSGPSISNVSVILSDLFNGTDETKLGKVIVATQTTSYSSEANGFTSITSTDNISGKQHYLFWYVAPDDFVGNNSADNNASSRFVDATFTVNYSNSTSETIIKKICIVRPPLMLVHGLGGAPSTWDNFQHNYNNFIFDPRFKVVAPIKLNPNSSFVNNAYEMAMGYTGPNFSNTFAGVINQLRNLGYASNRVDYVGHSMGGCILRSVITMYNSMYMRTGNYSSKPFKNYEQGYVNKFITIGTPHNSSPWADILNRYDDDLPWWFRSLLFDLYSAYPNSMPFSLLQGDDWNSFIPTFKITDAVKNLQIDQTQGGINFPTTNIKAHLIASDFFPGTQNTTTNLIPQEVIDNVVNSQEQVDWLRYLLKVAIANETNQQVVQDLTDILGGISNPTLQALKTIETMIDVVNTVAFIPESDLVVSVESQLASYPKLSPPDNVTIYENYIGHAFINSETQNTDIGNRVFQLLNTSINSSSFDIIPSTNNKSNSSISMSLLNNNPLNILSDTNKIKIIQPATPNSIFVDSTLHVKINVKDTTSLLSLELHFQGKTYIVKNRVTNPTLKDTNDIFIQTNSDLLDEQKLILEGYYLYTDSVIIAIDTINLNVIASDTLKGFVAAPEIANISIGELFHPNYYAIYQKYTTSVGNFSQFITPIIDNPTIVNYDTLLRGFTGLSAGETFAIIDYKGLKDTLYFVVNGCYSTASLVSISASDSTFICSNDSIILSAPSALYYDWSTGDTTQTISVNSSGSYFVTISDVNGCIFSSTPVDVTVITAPDVSVTSNVSTTFCQGDSIILTAHGGNLFLWNNGSVDSTITVTYPDTYLVNVTDSTTGCSGTNSISTYLYPPISISFSANNISCFGLNDGNVNSNVTGGTNPFLYSWSNGTSLPSISNLTSGLYILTVTDSTGCSLTQNININEPLQLIFDSLSMTNASCSDTTCNDGTATAYVSGGTGVVTYTWSNGGNTNTITGVYSATYFITITDSNGCTTDSSIFVDFFVGKNNIETSNFTFKVYPNPAKNEFYIKIENIGVHLNEIRLVNMFGQDIEKINNPIGNLFKINTQNIPNGFYRLLLISSDGIITGENVVIGR